MRLSCVLGILVVLLSVGVVHAHDGATGIVKERMASMKDMGKATKALNAMTKGNAEYDAKELKEFALVIARHAEKIPAFFPDTDASRSGKMTEALPSIWSDGVDFEARARELVKLGENLAATAATKDADAARQQFRAIGKSCSGCHKKYRKKKH